ncbi:gibberellin-regulated protein 1-like [Tripterygium wilfordii]|uniref:Gibberellin-regulated protein 1-like n=1 Tax=Tripterygium wilfordii TaxID=458696 RepID=A0A7J7D3E9_TRIWF|nr:gibberellin-regulated protein 1-like [Tripterygium wilfordii]KAF5740860.1 gibberellin-regulated protein 1-like [Tripterygium wilfordii]
MARSKALITSLLLFLLVLHLVQADDELVNGNQAAAATPKKIDCGAACKARCRLSRRPNLCKRACGTCCARCNCVPPGTYGNQEACACYANLTTHGGRKKCP